MFDPSKETAETSLQNEQVLNSAISEESQNNPLHNSNGITASMLGAVPEGAQNNPSQNFNGATASMLVIGDSTVVSDSTIILGDTSQGINTVSAPQDVSQKSEFIIAGSQILQASNMQQHDIDQNDALVNSLSQQQASVSVVHQSISQDGVSRIEVVDNPKMLDMSASNTVILQSSSLLQQDSIRLTSIQELSQSGSQPNNAAEHHNLSLNDVKTGTFFAENEITVPADGKQQQMGEIVIARDSNSNIATQLQYNQPSTNNFLQADNEEVVRQYTDAEQQHQDDSSTSSSNNESEQQHLMEGMVSQVNAVPASEGAQQSTDHSAVMFTQTESVLYKSFGKQNIGDDLQSFEATGEEQSPDFHRSIQYIEPQQKKMLVPTTIKQIQGQDGSLSDILRDGYGSGPEELVSESVLRQMVAQEVEKRMLQLEQQLLQSTFKYNSAPVFDKANDEIQSVEFFRQQRSLDRNAFEQNFGKEDMVTEEIDNNMHSSGIAASGQKIGNRAASSRKARAGVPPLKVNSVVSNIRKRSEEYFSDEINSDLVSHTQGEHGQANDYSGTSAQESAQQQIEQQVAAGLETDPQNLPKDKQTGDANGNPSEVEVSSNKDDQRSSQSIINNGQSSVAKSAKDIFLAKYQDANGQVKEVYIEKKSLAKSQGANGQVQEDRMENKKFHVPLSTSDMFTLSLCVKRHMVADFLSKGEKFIRSKFGAQETSMTISQYEEVLKVSCSALETFIGSNNAITNYKGNKYIHDSVPSNVYIVVLIGGNLMRNVLLYYPQDSKDFWQSHVEGAKKLLAPVASPTNADYIVGAASICLNTVVDNGYTLMNFAFNTKILLNNQAQQGRFIGRTSNLVLMTQNVISAGILLGSFVYNAVIQFPTFISQASQEIQEAREIFSVLLGRDSEFIQYLEPSTFAKLVPDALAMVTAKMSVLASYFCDAVRLYSLFTPQKLVLKVLEATHLAYNYNILNAQNIGYLSDVVDQTSSDIVNSAIFEGGWQKLKDLAFAISNFVDQTSSDVVNSTICEDGWQKLKDLAFTISDQFSVVTDYLHQKVGQSSQYIETTTDDVLKTDVTENVVPSTLKEAEIARANEILGGLYQEELSEGIVQQDVEQQPEILSNGIEHTDI